MPSAFSAMRGGIDGYGGTGTIAITVRMVIPTIVMAVVRVTPFLGTSFHGADRAIGADCRLSVMSVSGNRQNKKGRNQCSGSRCGKQPFKVHGIYLLSACGVLGCAWCSKRTPLFIRIV